MDPVLDTSPVDTYVDAAASGGEMVFVFVVIVLVLGVILVGLFFLLNAPLDEFRANRVGHRRRAEEQMREHKDLRQRIRIYARSRRDAVAAGDESPETAARAFRDYGEGVMDSVTSSTRSRRQIDRIRLLVTEEAARLHTSGPDAAES